MRRWPAIALLLPCAAWADYPMTYLGGTAGPIANRLSNLGWGLIGVSLLVAIFIALAVPVGILRNRAKGYEGRVGPPVSHGGNGLPWVYIGVSVSALLLIGSAIWTFFVMAATAAPPGNPKITLDVTGHQWWWEVRYRKEGEPKRTFLTANEIHIPVGQPVRIRLIGVDVIHSFWVPRLIGKTDVIPGQTNLAWIEADSPGVYRGQCTEYCGLQHAHMALHVVAQTPEKFKAWWDHQLQDAVPPTSPAARGGQRIFEQHCSVCHTVRGLGGNHGKLGPDLTHLMSRRMIAAGTLPNTTGYLAAWIENAPSLKPGVDMPTLALPVKQLQAVLSYVQTLH
ncbi:MAG TPA: cytochrome c oxidase subunit II [Nitrococcus sp.]|nr:cytochrome c oxidase subunit II [Nitrococcus sp.]